MNRVTVRDLGITFSVQCSSVTVCAVLLVSVLCCLQVAFNNMMMFLMHIITLENNLKCVLCCRYLIQNPQNIKHFIIECECDLIFCSN